MGRLHSPSLRYRTEWLLLGSALLLVGLLIGHFLYSMHGEITLRERERLTTQARVIHDNLVRQLDTINRTLAGLRTEVPQWQTELDGQVHANRRLKAFVDAMPAVRTLIVLNANGDVFASNQDKLIGQNFSHREYFKIVQKDSKIDTFYVGGPFKTVLGIWGLNVTRIILGPDGKFDGLITATLDPEEFQHLLESVRYAPDIRDSLVHGDGKIFLMAPPRPELLGSDLAKPGSLFSRHITSGESVTLLDDTVMLTKDRRMMVQHSVQPTALKMDKPLVIAISRDIKTLYASWHHEILTLGGFFLLLASTAIVSLYASQRHRRKAQIKNDQAEAIIQEKNEELERFFSASLDLLCIADFQGYFRKLNPAWEKALGYPLAELEGLSFMDLVHPDDREATREIGQQLALGNIPASFVNRYRTRSREYRFIEWRSVPHVERGLIYAAARDITEHLNVQRILAEQERFLRSLIDIIPGMVGYWDTDLRNRFSNISYLTWFNKTTEQMHGIRIQDLMSEELFKANEPFLRAALRGEAQHFERTLTKADGSIGYVWSHYIPDVVEGQVHGFFVLVSDITELKQAQIDLQKLNATLSRRTAEAEAANRAKSAFLANMSHEIRTPMNAVLGLLELLQHTTLDARQHDYAQKAHGAAQALLTILNDILDFSKVEAGKMVLENAPFRLDTLLRNLSVVLSAALTNKNVEVLFQLDPGIARSLRGDALRLQQVLLNLAGNAIKFTPAGEVVVALHLLESPPQTVRIEFSVRDTGIGIPADRLAAIFEGFTQAETSTTRRYGGTGLGLAISQRLVQLMGSELRVESTPGQGSHFSFALDFGRDEEDAVANTLTTQRAALPHLRILLVDDNAIALSILSEMAHSFGWEVTTAASGTQALEQLRHNSTHEQDAFDVICMDWLMPDMDGWEAVQHIRALYQGDKAPVILMVTAHGRKTMAEKMVSESNMLDGFLVKPITPSMLFDAVAQATGGNSITVQHPSVPLLPHHPPLAGLRILVVEDNPLNQQVAQELLAHAGAYVQVANDGRRGIESIESTQPPFDVVLMDIQMPEMDGYEATRVLRTEMGVTLPIIAMTANAMPSDRAACLEAGMNDHIGKPIDVAELIQTVLHYCTGQRTPTDADIKTTSPLQPSALPNMPQGFDLPGALARLDQNRALYATLARRFEIDQGPSVHRTRECLRQGDRSSAARELHTLKGVAATLGAETLAQLAAQMEMRIHTATTPHEDEVLLEQLDACLVHTIALFHQTAEAIDPVEATQPELLPDTNRLIAYLTELDSLLAQNNLRALDVYTAFKHEAGGGLGGQLAALDEVIAKFDFVAARAKIANLKNLLTP